MKRMTRLKAIEVLGGAGVALVAGCGSSPTSPSSAISAGTTGSAGAGTTTASGCAVAPDETEGPYPDRTGMINNPAYYRRDITEGKAGLRVTTIFTVVDARNNCSAFGVHCFLNIYIILCIFHSSN